MLAQLLYLFNNYNVIIKIISAKKATKPTELPTFSVAVTDGKLSWASTQYKSTKEVKSIMKRVPMHEPWAGHENLDPVSVAKDKTDREAE